MKNDRHGKAKILTQSEIQLLLSQSFQEERDRALFGICLFCACRIREACTLRVTDAYDVSGRILPRLTIGKTNTKGKLATCSIPIISDLWVLLTNIPLWNWYNPFPHLQLGTDTARSAYAYILMES
jgi:integrase/recombinase XerD